MTNDNPTPGTQYLMVKSGDTFRIYRGDTLAVVVFPDRNPAALELLEELIPELPSKGDPPNIWTLNLDQVRAINNTIRSLTYGKNLFLLYPEESQDLDGPLHLPRMIEEEPQDGAPATLVIPDYEPIIDGPLTKEELDLMVEQSNGRITRVGDTGVSVRTSAILIGKKGKAFLSHWPAAIDEIHQDYMEMAAPQDIQPTLEVEPPRYEPFVPSVDGAVSFPAAPNETHREDQDHLYVPPLDKV